MILQVCETRLYWRGPIMCMPHPTFESQPSLSPSQIADLRLAASKMTGPKRRAFEAEMTLKYCRGTPLMAEALFGWGRQTVALGLAERRTGIICLGAQSTFSGPKRREQEYGEDQLPSPSTMAEVLNRMGFRLRKVVKAKPQKKIKETDAIFDNIKKKTSTPCHQAASNA